MMLAVQQANMDSEIWAPDTPQNLDQPFGFGFPMRLFPVEQPREPISHTGSSCSKIEVEAATETRPATTKKRPHTKSRQGCLNCKARRVKCQETQPYPCSNCVGRNMTCVYPSKDQISRRRRPISNEASHRQQEQSQESLISTSEASPLTRWKNPPSHSPSTFSAADLRFLHHFLITAYPHLPFGSEDIWQTSLPAYAHECPHLMHSILSLGASHLSRITPNGVEYAPRAITHRGKALKALGKALAKSDQCTRTELDLLLATTYALTFQSNYMEDGLVDFIVMVRGCAIITLRILNTYERSEMFDALSADAIYTRVVPLLPMTMCCEGEVLDMSILALERIQPLLETSRHRMTYEVVLNTYRGLQRSAREGFIALCEIHNSWGRMENQEFRSFVDPGNHVSRLLLVHYVAITVMMWPVFCTLRPSMVDTPMADLTRCQWGMAIYHSLPLAMRDLVEWQVCYIASGGSIGSGVENSGYVCEL